MHSVELPDTNDPKIDTKSTSRRGRRAVAAIAVTAAATGVLSGVLATPANAAVRFRVWNRVAMCESTERWHINTGNGYYGGLQFSASTWRSFGGHRYARQANRATRVEQIQVARRVLAVQGPYAWPVCGPRAGLTRRSGLATRAALPNV